MVSVGCPCGEPRAQLEIEIWCSDESLGLRDMLGRHSLRNTKLSHGSGMETEKTERVTHRGKKQQEMRFQRIESRGQGGS